MFQSYGKEQKRMTNILVPTQTEQMLTCWQFTSDLCWVARAETQRLHVGPQYLFLPFSLIADSLI